MFGRVCTHMHKDFGIALNGTQCYLPLCCHIVGSKEKCVCHVSHSGSLPLRMRHRYCGSTVDQALKLLPSKQTRCRPRSQTRCRPRSQELEADAMPPYFLASRVYVWDHVLSSYDMARKAPEEFGYFCNLELRFNLLRTEGFFEVPR